MRKLQMWIAYRTLFCYGFISHTIAVIAFKYPDIEVAVVDISVPRITTSNRDQLPIYEPALDEVVK